MPQRAQKLPAQCKVITHYTEFDYEENEWWIEILFVSSPDKYNRYLGRISPDVFELLWAVQLRKWQGSVWKRSINIYLLFAANILHLVDFFVFKFDVSHKLIVFVCILFSFLRCRFSSINLKEFEIFQREMLRRFAGRVKHINEVLVKKMRHISSNLSLTEACFWNRFFVRIIFEEAVSDDAQASVFSDFLFVVSHQVFVMFAVVSSLQQLFVCIFFN